jgi:hypothetical protein
MVGHNFMATASVLSPRVSLPDSTGHFGGFGGMFVPETLMAPLQELAGAYAEARQDPAFQAELDGLLHNYVGRPTPLYFAERWTEMLGGAKIYLKREDLLHTGAHKINNALGQILLAKRLGKKRIIAETGAGQHGVATATVCARFGMECVVYMGKVDMERQALNVARMRLMGAEVRAVTAGQATLKEAVNEAMRDWVATVENTHYIIGSALGSHPFPMIVRDFHRVIGIEARRQILEKEGRLPDLLVAFYSLNRRYFFRITYLHHRLHQVIKKDLSFGPAISALPAAIVGIKDVIAEVQGATDEEKELLVDTFAAEFSISNAKAEEAIEHTLAVIVEFWKILKAFKK